MFIFLHVDSGSSSGVDELLSGMERLEQVEQMVGDCSGLLRAVKEAEQRADTKHAKDCLNKVGHNSILLHAGGRKHNKRLQKY